MIPRETREHRLRLLWVHDDEFDMQGDTATWIEMIANLQQGMEIRLLTDHRHVEIQPSELNQEVLYFPSARLPPYVKRIARRYRQVGAFDSTVAAIRPDAVILDTCNKRLLRHAVSAKQEYGLRLFYDVRTVPVDSAAHRRWLNEMVLAQSLSYAAKTFDGITYITPEMRDYCISRYRLPPHAHALWSSGVNGTVFAPELPSAVDRAGGPFKVLYHGSVARQRRISDVVKAMPLLQDLDVVFEVLGGGDGWEDLVRLVAALGLGSRVRLVGRVPHRDVPKWIARCDAGIVPLQDWYGWNVSSPIKLFECLACAKPVIVTDIPAHRNVLKDAEFAFWAKQCSPQDIAEAIRRAYQARADFQRLGAKARQLVLEEYTWAHQAQKLQSFLEGTTRR